MLKQNAIYDFGMAQEAFPQVKFPENPCGYRTELAESQKAGVPCPGPDTCLLY